MTLMVAMHRVVPPFGQARDDYAIFAALAERLGRREAFTEGRDADDWLRHLYARTAGGFGGGGSATRRSSKNSGGEAELELPLQPDDGGIMAAFRSDPEAHPLPTPSGRIEIASAAIAGFGYADCPGHPVWLAPQDPPDARHALWLIANQPARRLHSQLDFGACSQAGKQRGREVARMHPADAAARGIADGDVIRLFNERGACLAAVAVTEDVRPGVVHLPTGAWYDPADPYEARRSACMAIRTC